MVYKGSFEDILFVLAGLAWVGYSAYRANRKNSNKSINVVDEEGSESSSFLDDLLSQFEMDETEKETPINEKEQPVATENAGLGSDYNLNRTLYDDGFEKETLQKTDVLVDEVHKEINLDDQPYKKVVQKSKSFDLKKAFIYSEILKQKYI